MLRTLFLCYVFCGAIAGTNGGHSIEDLINLLPDGFECDPKSAEFLENKSYHYSYEATIENVNDEKVRTRINCGLVLNAVGKCRYVLYTNNCSLVEGLDATVHVKSPLFAKQMENFPIAFGMYAGDFHYLATFINDGPAVLNFKRGIIGSFQTMLLEEFDKPSVEELARMDLHGDCDYTYTFEEPNIIHSKRKLSKCSIIQSNEYGQLFISMYGGLYLEHMYSSEESCTRTFRNYHGATILESVYCEEAPTTDTFTLLMSFQPKIKRTLKLTSISAVDEDERSFLSGAYLTRIMFELLQPPKVNPPNLRKKIATLMEKIVQLATFPIELESIWLFNDLVDTLKSSADLVGVSKGVEDCWGSSRCDRRKSNFANTDHLQMRHIWRDALFKCNSRPCMKALQSYIVSSAVTRRAGVFGEQMLYTIYLRWLLVGSSHHEYIQSIYETCKYTKHPLCYLALSSNINRYLNFSYQRYKLNVKVRAIMDPFVETVSNCANESLKTSDILLAVKFISNIGEFADKVYPELTLMLFKCVIDPRVNWEVSLSSIQAYRRMNVSQNLLVSLLGIVRTEGLSQELRIHGYLMLMEKFGEEAVDHVHSLLKSESMNEVFKTFIYSHIKTILKTQNAARYKLAKALRKIVDEAGEDFISHETYTKYVSQYMEKVYYHKSPLLPLDVSTFGYLYTQVDLYDGTSFLPFSVTRHLQITLFGTDIDLGDLSIHSKGFSSVLASVISRIYEGGSKDSNALNHLLFNTNLKTNIKNVYFGHIGKELSESFGNITARLFESMQIPPSVFLNWNFLGEDAGFASFLTLLTFTAGNSGLSAGQTMFRTYMSIVGGSAEVPTTIGLRLKFAIEGEIPIALAQETSHHEVRPKEKHLVGITKFVSYSLGAVFRKSSTIELKDLFEMGYSDETFVSTSGSFDADLSLNMLADGKKKLHLEFPHGSRITFALRKHHVLIHDGQRKLEKIEPAKCGFFLFGTKRCWRNVFEYRGKYPVVYKSFEMQMPDHHPVTLEFEFQSTFNKVENVDVHALSIGAINHNTKMAHSILSGVYRYYSEKDVHELKVGSEVLSDFLLALNVRNFKSWDYEISLIGSYGHLLVFENRYKVSDSKFVSQLSNFAGEKLIKSKVINGEVDGLHIQYNGLVSVPQGNVTVQLVSQLFPLNYFHDLSTHFHCSDENAANWLKSIFESPIFWENSRSVKIDGHYETEIFLENVVVDVPESKSYGIIKLPKYKIEFDSEAIVDPNLTTDYTASLTSHRLPEKSLEWSYKFHQVRKFSLVDGVLSKEIVSKFSVPHLTLVCLVSRNQSEEYDRLAVKFQRRLYAEDSEEHKTNSPDFLSVEDEAESVKEVDFILNVDKSQDEEGRNLDVKSSLNLKGFPGYDSQGNFIYESDFGVNFTGLWMRKQNHIHVISSLNSSSLNRSLVGESEFSGDDLKLSLLLLTNEANALANYSFNLNFLPNNVLAVKRISSSVYNLFSQMSMVTGQPHVSIDLTINASSPHWSLLDLNLTQQVSEGSETMSMSHELMDVLVEASWLKGYHKSFSFNSKMSELIPTMRWKLDCDSLDRCVAQLVFASEASPSTLFVIYELSPGGTQLAFTVCWNDLCNHNTKNSNFIGKFDVSILSSYRLIKSLMINPEKVEELKKLLLDKASMLVLIVGRAIGNPNHPLHSIYQHFVGISVDETANRVFTLVPVLSQTLLTDAANIFSSLLPAVYSTVGKLSSPFDRFSILQPGDFNVLIHSPRHVHRLMTFTLMAVDFYWDRGFRPHFDPLESWVSETPLPFKLHTFKALEPPYHLNPSWFRYLSSFIRGEALYHEVFYDEDFSRVALVIGNDLVMPFQGELISIDRPNCHQVLSFDVEEQRFIVYKQDYWLKFIFTNTQLELSINDGRLIVNSTRREFPFESPDEEFNVIRLEDLVVLETPYHLQVVCDVRRVYCVFSTDVWKYGRLYGLLGNNTDDVDPEIAAAIESYNRKFVLFDPFGCEEEEEGASSVAKRERSLLEELIVKSGTECNAFQVGLPVLSSTFACHDVIEPASFFNKCLSRDLQDDSKGAHAVIKAYLAACGTLGLRTTFQPIKGDNCAGHSFGSSWVTDLSKRKLEVVFLVDQNLCLAAARHGYSKGLTNLALTIKRDFHNEHFSEVKFGLFGIGTEVSMYSADSEFWSSAEDFSLQSLSHLLANPAFNDAKERGSGEVLRAIRFLLDITPFDHEAIHLLVLLTPHDPFDNVRAMDFYLTLKELLSRQIAFHTISNYEEFSGKTSGFPFSKIKKQQKDGHSLVFKESILGHYSKLSAATKGSLWSLAHLANKTNQKLLSDVSKELVEGAKARLSDCLRCSCREPFRFFSPSAHCHPTQCPL